MNTTIEYFDEKAEKIFREAFTITSRDSQKLFASYMKEGGVILDFGCGSGRDSAWFREQGFEVVPCDGSPVLANLAQQYLGTPVKVMEFNELDETEVYDGIYASASIMHLEYDQLLSLFPKMIRALKPEGILYVSFKYGENDGYYGKRYFTYMTEERFAGLAAQFPQLKVLMTETFGNPQPGLHDFRWFHAVLKKKGNE